MDRTYVCSLELRLSCGVRVRAGETGLTERERERVVFLLTVPERFLCWVLLNAIVVSHWSFVLSLFVPHVSFLWCLGMALPLVTQAFPGYLHL